MGARLGRLRGRFHPPVAVSTGWWGEAAEVVPLVVFGAGVSVVQRPGPGFTQLELPGKMGLGGVLMWRLVAFPTVVWELLWPLNNTQTAVLALPWGAQARRGWGGQQETCATILGGSLCGQRWKARHGAGFNAAATSHSLSAGAAMVLLTDVGMFMVLAMVTELLTLSPTLSLSPPLCWVRVYPFPAHAEMQSQPPVHQNINL